MASESIDSYRDLDVQNKTVLGEIPGGAGAWGLVGSEGDGRWMGWLGYGIYIYDYVLPYYFLTKSSLLNVEADL